MSIQDKLLILRDLHTEDEIDQLLTAAIHSSGVIAIARERLRQISREGYSSVHDDRYAGQMAKAAAAYAEHAGEPGNYLPNQWPWASSAWKPGSPERNLEKAGALAAAEIDTIIRTDQRNRIGGDKS